MKLDELGLTCAQVLDEVEKAIVGKREVLELLLLGLLADGQVPIEGETHALELPFLVLATQNPIEYEGTYPLPEAQLDRFLLRASVGYPGRDQEREILGRRAGRKTEEVELKKLLDGARLVEM